VATIKWLTLSQNGHSCDASRACVGLDVLQAKKRSDEFTKADREAQKKNDAEAAAIEKRKGEKKKKKDEGAAAGAKGTKPVKQAWA